MSDDRRTPVTSLDVRERLVEALRLDLVGPPPGHAYASERLRGWERPSGWYLTGFLIPSCTPPEKSADPDEDDDMESEVPQGAGLAEESTEERKAAKKGYYPSSMGLSFLVPREARTLNVIVRWGDYTPEEIEGEDGKPLQTWRRTAREASVALELTGSRGEWPRDVPDGGGLQLHVVEQPIVAEELAAQIPAGTRSVSIFLVNHRPPDEQSPDVAYAFQAEIEVRCAEPFVPRPDLSGALADQWDEQVADLHYADTPEYATGHGVSADWEIVDGACRVIRTAWIPAAEVEKTTTFDVPGVELSMEALGALPDGAAATAALSPLVSAYRSWIERERRALAGRLEGTRRETAEELLRLAGVAAGRMERGIAALASDPDALDSFRVANRAVARALTKRLGIEAPRWRAFQLAFLLLNLPGMVEPTAPDREIVDLLFFPTGGGKTEAYLGLAAFAMVLRRLRHPEDGARAGAGVSVIMRYTLRLLTLDQLGRAAGLVCALELERAEAPQRYGVWPFEIGLWVGKAATPNVLGRKGDQRDDTARAKVRRFKQDSRRNPSPIPLENCPWCGKRFTANSFALLPNDDEPRELRIVCADFECEFSGGRALPIVAVDEPVYRRLPAFLIATVDKFASLPWVAQSGALLGGADRYDGSGFYGAAEPGYGKRLRSAALPPPDLVIQDELHLISGPLGTMAGLYEAAIEALCVREIEGQEGRAGRAVRPKIVASTATVRRAQDQIQALFARGMTQVFPPPGPGRRDSFFARTVPSSEVPARLYLGVSAQGRNPKVVMRRAWLALMGAGQRAWLESGGELNRENPADPYMTVLGYFNALRELGGARRILEEEVQNTLKAYGTRRRIDEKAGFGLFRDRKSFSEVVELTSRVSTDKVAEARRRLEAPFHRAADRVDCAIATNMISVGLDIPRLGLMVVLGQPKTHAEYIQATSRVGRDDRRPGLVVTLLNIHKPRDRSHYERFRHYHESFYRSVEVGSVTPFSARALDRGFAGALVALARHAVAELTPPQGAERIVAARAALERRLLDAFLERVRQQPFASEEERQERMRSVQNRVVDLLDSWRKVYEDYRRAGVAVQYQKYELWKKSPAPQPLLREMLDSEFESEHHRKFRANRSLRDVEPDVNLFLKDLTGVVVEEEEERARGAQGEERE
ncbi:MAG: DISARM system helicase DrmA [Candidatus Eisenbacteria bacterium]